MTRSLAARALGAIGVALLVVGMSLPTVASAEPATSLAVPAHVTLDATNAITLHLPRTVGAVEGRVLVAGGAAELVGVAPIGKSGQALSPVAVAGGYSFGAYGLKAKGQRTDLRLVFVAKTSGQLEVRVLIDAAANATGGRLKLTAANLLTTVQAGRGGARRNAPSASPHSGPPRSGTSLRGLFGRAVLSQDDIDAARASWYAARVGSVACKSQPNSSTSADDANGDGCVDIVDLQALFARRGQSVATTTNPNAVPDAVQSAAATSLARVATGGSQAAQAAALAGRTFVVISTADTPDAHNGDGICADSVGNCTLRAALTESNWDPGQNTVNFNLPGPAPVTIQVGSSKLPLIGSASSSVFIDGYSQPGSQPNTAEFGTNAIPGVMVRGNGNSSTSYIFYSARPNNTIRGLLLANAYSGVFLDTPGASNNRIVGNWIGFNRDNSMPPRGHAGVWLNNGAHDNLVGTPDLADRNVIGNSDKGVYEYGAGTDRNIIQNNVLCIRPNALGALCQVGVDNDFGPKASLIGGSGLHERNYFGPTSLNGVELSHGWDPTLDSASGGTLKWQINDHRVIGNWVGFRVDGSYDPAFRSALNQPTFDNGQALHIHDGCNFNLFEANYVAAAYDGVTISMSNATGNVVHANIIGVSPLGQPAPLGRYGIYFDINTRNQTADSNIIRNAAGGGIVLVDPNIRQIRISRNIISDTNGPAIYLAPDPNDPSTGANGLLASPQITTSSVNEIAGTGIPNATVEVFQASRPAGQAGLPIVYLGAATVGSDTNWSLPVSLQQGQRVTATQIKADGNTSSLSTNVFVGSAPPVPTADFDWAQRPSALTVDFTDTSLGQPTSWTWNFGDGTSSTLENPSKTYAQAGDYNVTLTAANSTGSDVHTEAVTVTPLGAGTVLAADSFSRTVGSGWDDADTGGTYTLEGPVANFTVGSGLGTLTLPTAGSNRAAILDSVTGQDVDMKFRVAADKVAAGSNYYVYMLTRHNGGNALRPKLIFNTNGTIAVHAGVTINNSESSLAPAVVVPGLTQSPNGFIWLRAQIIGTNPTTVNVKAWADGQPEPAGWQFTASDSHAAVQVAGGVGVRAYVNSGATNMPLTFSFDDLSATVTVPPPPGPVAADTFGRTVNGGWGSAESGGAYALQGPASDFSVNSGAGSILSPTTNKGHGALLDGAVAADVDVLVRISADRVAAGGAYFVYAVCRRNGTSEYRPRLILNANGSVTVGASVLNNGAESAIGTGVVVSGLTQAANSFIWLRAQVTGSGPTTIKVKAWADGQSEPSGWQYSATNQLGALQGTGSFGLRTYVAGAAPVTLRFDDLAITDIP